MVFIEPYKFTTHTYVHITLAVEIFKCYTVAIFQIFNDRYHSNVQ